MNATPSSVAESRWFWAGPLGRFVLVGLPMLLGLGYIVLQWQCFHAVRDALFVGLLLGATATLYEGMRLLHEYLRDRAVVLFSSLLEQEGHPTSAPSKLLRSVFGAARTLPTGVLYGCVVGSTPVVLGAWQEDASVRYALVGFLFSVNFLTGMGFHGLIAFFVAMIRIGACVDVDLWDRSNPAARVIVRTTHACAIVAAAYVCLSLLGIKFSVLRIGGITIGYSAFALLVILAAILLPMMPIRNRIAAKRREALDRLERDLQREFERVVEPSADDAEVIDLARFEGLLKLRRHVESIHAFPFRGKLLQTGTWVFFLTVLPPILEMLLKLRSG